jgi:ABC-type spermidine/putrescine transport system permease subunit II
MNALLRKGSGLCWLVAVYAFLLAPLVVVIGASFSSGDRTYIEFPPTSLTLHWYGEIPETIIRSLTVSLSLALATSLAATLIGVPAALGLVRSPVPGKKTIAAVCRSCSSITSWPTRCGFRSSTAFSACGSRICSWRRPM